MEKILDNRLIRAVARRAKFIIRPIRNLVKGYEKLRDRRLYHVWAIRNEQFCFVDHQISDKKKVSIVVPTYNTEHEHLMEMVYSVVNQHYQNWELIVVNASTDIRVKESVKSLAEIDTRINVLDPGENLGIAENTNVGLRHAKGDYTAFLDHDDVLHPCALHAMMDTQQQENADIIYSDEDKMSHDGSRYSDPFCKPNWSPHLFENVNYLNHLTIIRSDLVSKAKGLKTNRNGAQDYDLLLRVLDDNDVKISHTPLVLYHWRAARTSTASDISTKPYIFKAGQSALQDHFNRTGIDAKVEILEGKPGFYRTVYPSIQFDIVVNTPTKNNQPATAKWLNEIREDNPETHIIVGDWFSQYCEGERADNVSIVSGNGEDFLTQSANKLRNNTVVMFSAAATPRKKYFLAEIAAVSHATNLSVQPVLVSEKGDIEDAGLVDAQYGLQPLFVGYKYGENTFFGSTDWVRDISASNGLVIAIPKSEFTNISKRSIVSKKNHPILWSHAIFELHHKLMPTRKLSDFNPLLNGTKSDISMVTVEWPKKEERAHE